MTLHMRIVKVDVNRSSQGSTVAVGDNFITNRGKLNQNEGVLYIGEGKATISAESTVVFDNDELDLMIFNGSNIVEGLDGI